MAFHISWDISISTGRRLHTKILVTPFGRVTARNRSAKMTRLQLQVSPRKANFSAKVISEQLTQCLWTQHLNSAFLHVILALTHNAIVTMLGCYARMIWAAHFWFRRRCHCLHWWFSDGNSCCSPHGNGYHRTDSSYKICEKSTGLPSQEPWNHTESKLHWITSHKSVNRD